MSQLNLVDDEDASQTLPESVCSPQTLRRPLAHESTQDSIPALMNVQMNESTDICIMILHFLLSLYGQHPAQELAHSRGKIWRDGERKRAMNSMWHPVGPQKMTDQSQHNGFSSIS